MSLLLDPRPLDGRTALVTGAGHGTARFFPVDVTDEDSVRGVVDKCTGAFGKIDVLVNNPSRYRDTRFTALEDIPCRRS